MRVLGVDPGTIRTGVGMIVVERGQKPCVTFLATIHAARELPLAERLREIYTHLVKVVTRERPTVMAIESCFAKINIQSAVSLGHARGLALLAAAEAGVPVTEYAPARVKQSVSGNGRASKQQMQYMVRQLLSLEKEPAEDAADALSVALCHIQMAPFQKIEAREKVSPASHV